MESRRKIPWYLVNYPHRGMIKNDSTTAIDRGFLYIGINSFFSSNRLRSHHSLFVQRHLKSRDTGQIFPDPRFMIRTLFSLRLLNASYRNFSG